MTQITDTKIVLLLFVPIANHFNFPSSTEKCRFLDLTETRKKWFAERKSSVFSKEQ
jgi:hypothetical protein